MTLSEALPAIEARMAHVAEQATLIGLAAAMPMMSEDGQAAVQDLLASFGPDEEPIKLEEQYGPDYAKVAREIEEEHREWLKVKRNARSTAG